MQYLGAIEVSIVTMSKRDRSKTDEVYVCGFVPCYQLPNKRPNSLDPFLSPLIEEIEELFINGICIKVPTIADITIGVVLYSYAFSTYYIIVIIAI